MITAGTARDPIQRSVKTRTARAPIQRSVQTRSARAPIQSAGTLLLQLAAPAGPPIMSVELAVATRRSLLGPIQSAIPTGGSVIVGPIDAAVAPVPGAGQALLQLQLLVSLVFLPATACLYNCTKKTTLKGQFNSAGHVTILPRQRYTCFQATKLLVIALLLFSFWPLHFC